MILASERNFNTFSGRKIPALMCGTSPFIGAGQFGMKALEYRKKFFDFPERMAEIFVEFGRLGMPGAHLIGYPTILEAAEITRSEGEFIYTGTNTPGRATIESIHQLGKVECEIIFVHGMFVDDFNIPIIQKLVGEIENVGAIPGFATHEPTRTLPKIIEHKESLGAKALLVPVNPLGYAMDNNVNETVELMEKCGLDIVAMKPLAAGRIPPEEGFKFALTQPNIKAVTVGISSKDQVESTVSAFMSVFQ